MAATIATMAMILRSIASAPVGGPAGASGSGTATRATDHSTAPRTRSRKNTVISAGRFSSTSVDQAQAGGGTASAASATAREMALDGPVSTVMRPVPSILI